MTWYCPDWTQRLQGNYIDTTFEDGDDWDEIFGEARCSSFTQSATAYIDEDGTANEYQLDNDSEAYCGNHDRTAEWDATYSVSEDLDGAGFSLCHDCETVYHDQNALDEHMGDDHDADDNQPPAYRSSRPTVATSHSNWPA